MNFEECYLSLGKKARGLDGKPVIFNRPVELIVIHWIGPYFYQTIHAPFSWWENGSDGLGISASAHFIVKDEDVLQTLPLNEVGWHAGDERNYYSIGIEVIPENEAGKFSDKTINTLKELIRQIREIYPKTKLTRHYDGVQKKDCPRYYTPLAADLKKGDERWAKLQNFLDDVEGELT